MLGRTVFAVVMAFAVSGSASAAGVVKRDALLKVSPGQTKDEIAKLLGPPGNRTFLDAAEAWQYCRTGISTDEYTTLWFKDGTVRALTTLNAAIAQGFCSGRWPPVDWGQAPPDIRVRVEQR